MKIQLATTEDTEQLSTLLTHLFEKEVEFSPNRELQQKGLKKIITDPDIGEILIARKSDRIIGMVNLLYTVSTALGCKVAILEDMIVLPGYRNSGTGSCLLKEAEAKSDRFDREVETGAEQLNTPFNPLSVPEVSGVPEPDLWMLLGVVVFALFLVWQKQRSAKKYG